MRREFDLPEADRDHLDARGTPWETIVEQGVHWLLLHEFEIPPGYNHGRAIAALRIEDGYPSTQIDMVYFEPQLARSDGRTINNLSHQRIDGRQFQRWSRHRTKANAWREGIDDVSAHLLLVRQWLKREFEIR